MQEHDRIQDDGAGAPPPRPRGRRRARWGIAVACVPPVFAAIALAGGFSGQGMETILWALAALPLCLITAPVAIGLGASAIAQGERGLGRAAVFAGVCDVGAPIAIIVLLYAL